MGVYLLIYSIAFTPTPAPRLLSSTSVTAVEIDVNDNVPYVTYDEVITAGAASKGAPSGGFYSTVHSDVHFVCNATPPYALYIFEGVLLIVICVLAWRVRNVDPKFNEAKVVVGSVWIIIVVGLAVVPLSHTDIWGGR